MAHENITNLRRQEIYTMLLEMDKIFGRKFNGQAPTFLLYGPYEDNHGVIFPVSWIRISFISRKKIYVTQSKQEEETILLKYLKI